MEGNILLLFSLYFAQGFPYGIQTKFLPIYLRSRHISLSKVSLSRLLSLPWLLKVLVSPLVDKLASRWLWLACTLFAMAIMFSGPALLGTVDSRVVIFAVLGLNIMAASQDIAVDSMAVTILERHELGLGNIAQVVGYKMGALVGGGGLLWLSSYASWENIFCTITIFYVLSAFCALRKHSMSSSQLPQNKQARWVIGAEDRASYSENYNNHSFSHSSAERISYKEVSVTRRSCHHQPAGSCKGSMMCTESVQMISNTSQDHRSVNRTRSYANIISGIWYTKGFQWLLLYVLVYKLGEQGMVSMLPMYLLDSGLSAVSVGVISGIWAQVFSVSGSTIGGWLASKCNTTSNGLIQLLTYLSSMRLLPMGIHCLSTYYGLFPAVVITSECVLQLIGGAITTATFTLMMQNTKDGYGQNQGTHFSILATVEVLGKLSMMCASGVIVEYLGYQMFFSVCLIFAALVVPVLMHSKRRKLYLISN